MCQQSRGDGAQAVGDVLVVDQLQRHPNGRRVRFDALPEHLAYLDEGCDLAPSCLRCPFAVCRYDGPSFRALRLMPRDEAIRQRRGEGAEIDVLAEDYGLSRRSVFRILVASR